MTKIRQIFLQIPSLKRKWEQFLHQQGLTSFSEAEVTNLDFTLGLYEGQKLLGTGSISDNVLKFIAVIPGELSATYFNQIVSALQSYLVQNGQTHMMVFTKPQYEASFNYVGFKTLTKTIQGCLLESGNPGIQQYFKNLPNVSNQNQHQVAAVVVNANPFTMGHRYLIEKAAQENEIVDVFVLSANHSLFTSDERFHLVKLGVADFKNVRVFPGGSYLVSYATFPAYFIVSKDNVIRYQTTLDAQLFRDQIAPVLNIKRRYLGDEPFSHTTNIYNQTLKAVLPPKIQVVIIPRLQQGNQIVTATAVRQAIAHQKITMVKDFLPEITYQFIQDHQSELLERIRKGVNIGGN